MKCHNQCRFLGRIVADTYCEVSHSMSVFGRIVADTYCEVPQGLLTGGADVKRSVSQLPIVKCHKKSNLGEKFSGGLWQIPIVKCHNAC